MKLHTLFGSSFSENAGHVNVAFQDRRQCSTVFRTQGSEKIARSKVPTVTTQARSSNQDFDWKEQNFRSLQPKGSLLGSSVPCGLRRDYNGADWEVMHDNYLFCWLANVASETLPVIFCHGHSDLRALRCINAGFGAADTVACHICSNFFHLFPVLSLVLFGFLEINCRSFLRGPGLFLDACHVAREPSFDCKGQGGSHIRTMSAPGVHCLRRCCCCTKSEPVPVESNWGLKWPHGSKSCRLLCLVTLSYPGGTSGFVDQNRFFLNQIYDHIK